MSKKYIVPVSSGIVMTENKEVYKVMIDSLSDGSLWAFISQAVNDFIESKFEESNNRELINSEELILAMQSLKEDTEDIKKAILTISEFTKKTDINLVKFKEEVIGSASSQSYESTDSSDEYDEFDDDLFDSAFDDDDENSSPFGGISLDQIKEINKQITAG